MEWNKLGESAFTMAKEKGFHADVPCDQRGTLIRIALIHTEISEVAQLIKRYGIPTGVFLDRFGFELADTAIRLGDMCHGLDIDLEALPWARPQWPTDQWDRHALLMRCGVLHGYLTHFWEAVVQQRPSRVYPDLICLARGLEELAAHFGLELEAQCLAKMAVNRKRPYRYGTPEEHDDAPHGH